MNSNFEFGVLAFEERVKLEPLEEDSAGKDKNQKQTQSTYDKGSRIQTWGTLVRGEHSYRCATPIYQSTFFGFSTPYPIPGYQMLFNEQLQNDLQNSNLNGKVPDLDETLQYSAFISSATFKAFFSICEKFVSFYGNKYSQVTSFKSYDTRHFKQQDAPQHQTVT